MNDANFRPSHPRTSLADLLHKTPTPPLHVTPQSPQSDGGSQQERNHQRPHPPDLPRLPPPGDVSRTARNTPHAADTSPKHPHPHRKRKFSSPLVPPGGPDLSSLTQTQKPDDLASSVALPASRGRPRTSPVQVPNHVQDKFQQAPDVAEGSTDMLPAQRVILNPDDLSPGKPRRRVVLKESRTDLLEENRDLRIELERVKYRLRKADAQCKRYKKDTVQKDALLAKYRSQLVGLFEAGEDDFFHLSKRRPSSPRSPENRDRERDHERKQDENSRVDGESISNSQEEDWSTYSAPSASYDHDQSEDRRRNSERDPYSRADGGIRKVRRTRAPAWTPEEEVIFMDAYNKHGCRWKLFQDSLPGRSRRQIQSHGSYLIRQGKLRKKNSRPWQRRKPLVSVPSSSLKDAEIEETAERSEGE